jgi:hypothetical protein
MTSLASVSNPFQGDIVRDAWQSLELDVPEIHAEQFQLCCRAVDWVLEHRQSAGVLLHGEPGSGKTHLLTRLRARFVQTAEKHGPAPRRQVVFVSFRLQTSPAMIWRHLRRHFVDDLLRKSAGGVSQLERMLAGRLAEAKGVDGDPLAWWQSFREQVQPLDELERELDDLFEHIDGDAQLGHPLSMCLIHLLLGRRRREAKTWLRGDPLPGEALKKLGIGAPGEDEGELEDQSRQVVLGICRLADRNTCFLFSFDQVEALQTDLKDAAGLRAFGKVVVCLHDETRNSVLITCLQSALTQIIKEALHGAEFDRVSSFAKGGRAINVLEWPLARKLTATRLAAAPELRGIRPRGAGDLWPLDEARVRETVGVGCTPRRLLSRCAELFEHVRGDRPPPVCDLSEMLENEWSARFESALAGGEASQTDEILQHGIPLLAELVGKGGKPGAASSSTKASDIDFVLSDDDGCIAVSVCNQNARGLHWRLKRIRGRLDGGRGVSPYDRLVLLRDPRQPIGKGAKTRELFNELTDSGATVINPSVEVLAALEALRSLLSDAKAGDLAHRGEAVPVEDLKAWLVRKLPDCLTTFVDDLFSHPRPYGVAPAADRGLVEDLAELIEIRCVLDAREAALELGRDLDEIETCAHGHPERFGVLAGPATVLLRRVPQSPLLAPAHEG